MHQMFLETATPDAVLPLVVRPTRPSDAEALASLLREQRPLLMELLLEHGALLFRGFDASEPEDLLRVLEANGGEPMRYFGGISPRRTVAEPVYTATELPPGVHIPLHNELSYLDVYPRHLWFSCSRPAARGGETTLASTRAVLRGIASPVLQRFVERGVRYECSFHGESLFHDLLDRVQKVTKSWMEAFETDDRRLVDQRCREVGATPHWLESGRLVLETHRPAVIDHPITGETVWFNSSHLFHLDPRGLGWSRYLLSRLYELGAEAPTHDATYGDGTPIEHETLVHLYDVLEAETVPVRWQRGDLLWIDNLLCMHGRNPYRGERRLLAALTQ
jgi:alpha-ketoglutarate-dependent taurine dioxygenase